MKLVLVGEAPGRTGPPTPLMGRAGKKIAEMMGVTLTEYGRQTERLNLLERYPGAGWPTGEARKRGGYLSVRLRNRVVILLGRRVATAFGYPGARWFEWMESALYRESLVIVVPHPSGRNRWWNDSCHAQLARIFWRTMAKHWWMW